MQTHLAHPQAHMTEEGNVCGIFCICIQMKVTPSVTIPPGGHAFLQTGAPVLPELLFRELRTASGVNPSQF